MNALELKGIRIRCSGGERKGETTGGMEGASRKRHDKSRTEV